MEGLKLGEKVGDGASSDVFLAHDQQTGENWAIKRIAIAWMQKSPDRKKQIDREMEIQVSGHH